MMLIHLVKNRIRSTGYLRLQYLNYCLTHLH